jgi:hypothetical protein
MISGDNQYPGFIDLDPTSFPFPVDKPNLGTQLESAGVKWRSYQESMGTACKLSGAGTYAPKHDPFLYFKDQQSGPCAATNVDYSQFAADLATNEYRYMWITPNLTSDGHDPSNDPAAALTTSDTWMSHEVPKILASDGFKANGILFITWDEAEGRNGDDADKIPMLVLSPRVTSPLHAELPHDDQRHVRPDASPYHDRDAEPDVVLEAVTTPWSDLRDFARAAPTMATRRPRWLARSRRSRS